MLLADKFLQRRRPHPHRQRLHLGQRLLALFRKKVHALHHIPAIADAESFLAPARANLSRALPCASVRLGVAIFLAAYVCAPAIRAGEDTVRAGPHFRVTCHFDNPSLAAAALETAEDVWPVASELFKITTAPEPLLEIHLYRTTADYETAEAQRTHGRFRRNLAFSDYQSKAAYIAVQPECSDAVLKVVGLPFPTRRLVAHEAAHIVRFWNMPNFASHPEWLGTGAALWIASETMTRNHGSSPLEDDPRSSQLMWLVQDLQGRGKLPSIRAILRDDIQETEFYTQYALRGLLFRFLNTGERRPKLAAVLAEAQRLGGSPEVPRQLFDFFVKTFDLSDFETLDRDFAAYVRSLSPKWNEVYRSLETAGDDWTQTAFPDVNAVAWRTTPVGKSAYTLSGALTILPGAAQQLNLLLARTPEGFVSIAFVAGFGVNVFDYHAKEERWQELGHAEVPTLLAGRKIAFAVHVHDRRIDVTLDGKQVLSAATGDRPITGPWGLGAQARSAGIWSSIQLK
jgi:hypothetical protein